ncbi:MAG: 50S ribosomal protein L7Ae [Candidatus Helarchaeota archaeon]
MSKFAKYKVSEELENMALEVLDIAVDTGKIKRGINETTKAIERGIAKLVYFAGDVTPPEIIMHLPPLCSEKKTPFIMISDKKKLGKRAGIEVPTSSVAIIDPGDGVKILKDLIFKLTNE